MGKEMETICREIGERIAFYRKRRNMTIEELAKKVSETTEYIKKIEGDYSLDLTPLSHIWSAQNLDLFFKIAEALQMDIAAFLQPTIEENYQKFRKDI